MFNRTTMPKKYDEGEVTNPDVWDCYTRTSKVLGPDGEPYLLRRQPIGFILKGVQR